MRRCYKWVGTSRALFWLLVFPGYFQKYFKLCSSQREWCREYINARACQMLRKRRHLRLAQRRSIYLSGVWNRHSAISVHHFCSTSISEMLFAYRQWAPGDSVQHFPFHLCVAGSGSTAICLWLFPFSLSEFKLRCRKREVGAGRVVKWNTYTRSRTQTQSELPTHTQR